MAELWTLHVGDVRAVLPTLDEGAFDAVLCDPPYELGFMGKKWDASGVAFDASMWAAVLARLRPGAPLLAFGGTRTYHRMVCAIEDAGFEIRDCLTWLYGSGFPKSHNISKAIDAAAGATRAVVGIAADFARDGSERKTDGSHVVPHEQQGGHGFGDRWSVPVTVAATEAAKTWDGYGTALKPSWEPIVLARKPLDGTVAENVQTHGVGGIAIDAARIATDWTERPDSWKRSGHTSKPDAEKIAAPPGNGIECNPLGRWPANLVLDEEAAAQLDKQSGITTSGAMKHEVGAYDGDSATPFLRGRSGPSNQHGDTGGVSRFFYTSKVSTSERNDGLDDLGGLTTNPHPTMKPVSLTEYLAKLIIPPRGIGRPRRLLVPFCGVASEIVGALRAGWDDIVGIEMSEEYAKIAMLRLRRIDTSHQPSLFG